MTPRQMGRKGGKAGTGASKRRGDADAYRALQQQSLAARRQRWTYSARTTQQDGTWLEHVGLLKGAVAKAKAYARANWPAWEYKGYGPTITVRDADGREVHCERL